MNTRGGKGEKNIVIPNGVTHLDLDYLENTGVEKLTIPASVTSISYSYDLKITSLNEIEVNEDNEKYFSKDGVLFETYKWSDWEYDPEIDDSREVKHIDKTLRYYPLGKEDETYTVPEETTDIDVFFTDKHKVKKVVIPSSIGSLNMDMFDNGSVETVEFKGEYAPQVWCSDEAFSKKNI